jgi:hypothetical protein
MANIMDGLNGFSLVNKHHSTKSFQWKKIFFEVLYTKSQGGESWSVPGPSGRENYYNHYQYLQGWSYQEIGIGNPFISQRTYTREGLPSTPFEYFINNRLVAFHFGYGGSVHAWDFILETSYSLNYGAYRTINLFPEIKQFSMFLDAHKELKKGLNIEFAGAFDVGELYYDSVGILVRVGKSF